MDDRGSKREDRVSEIGFILYMFVKVWERYRMYKSDVLYMFVYVCICVREV